MKRIKNTIIILVYFIFCNDLLFAATEHVFIDTVYSVNWGSSQNFGRSEKYFPMNIFGPPSSTATKYVPAATEDEVCSLGKGGEIIVGCKNHYIVNGEGVDEDDEEGDSGKEEPKVEGRGVGREHVGCIGDTGVAVLMETDIIKDGGTDDADGAYGGEYAALLDE